MSVPVARVSRLTVSCLPEECPEYRSMSLDVMRIPNSGWMVFRDSSQSPQQYLGNDLEWSWGINDDMSDEQLSAWHRTHVFKVRKDAIELAMGKCKSLTLNGKTVSEIYDKWVRTETAAMQARWDEQEKGKAVDGREEDTTPADPFGRRQDQQPGS